MVNFEETIENEKNLLFLDNRFQFLLEHNKKGNKLVFLNYVKNIFEYQYLPNEFHPLMNN